jgi:hypothetical protein
MRGGVMGGGQSAPVQRFDMHRPERLDGRRALRRAQPGGATPPFRVRLVVQGLGVSDRSNPASECARVETVLNAIFGAAKPAPAPRLDVDRQPRLPSRVLEMFRSHRRSSNARRNPKWTANAPPIRCARTGRLHSTKRRRDKSGSPVAIQALDRHGLSPCRSVGSRAAPGHKSNDFKEPSGTTPYSPPSGSRR